MEFQLCFEPLPAALAAAVCARGAASSPCAPPAAGCKRRWGQAHSDARSCCSLGTGLDFRTLEDRSACPWPECETCGRQDLLHLACTKCASPVCGECVGGKCGVCGADLQRAFRGCDLCGRVFRRRGTRMCVHCTETWCFGCIDRVGTCGCGCLTEEGFLMPLEQVEARPPPPGAGGSRGGARPCLSTASSCNLATLVADTAASGGGPPGGPAAAGAAAAPGALEGAGSGALPAGPAGARAGSVSASASAAAAAAQRLVGAAAAFDGADSDDDGPQWSSNGGSCCP